MHSDSNEDMLDIINKLLQKRREGNTHSAKFPREDKKYLSQDDEETSSRPPPFSHFFEGRSFSTPLNRRRLLYNLSTNSSSHSQTHPFPPMSRDQIEKNKLAVEEMFRHAYDGYMYNAFPWSELKPLSCGPGTFHLVRLPAFIATLLKHQIQQFLIFDTSLHRHLLNIKNLLGMRLHIHHKRRQKLGTLHIRHQRHLIPHLLRRPSLRIWHVLLHSLIDSRMH
jgi:hypothetical protein